MTFLKTLDSPKGQTMGSIPNLSQEYWIRTLKRPLNILCYTKSDANIHDELWAWPRRHWQKNLQPEGVVINSYARVILVSDCFFFPMQKPSINRPKSGLLTVMLGDDQQPTLPMSD